MIMLNQKGAMFGLDARIALVIFGSLSVIAGAALYSAIQQSRVVAVVTDMSEASKAFESYMLDTGSLPADSATSTDKFNAEEMVENVNGVAGWSGPYLSYDKCDDGFGGVDDGCLVHNTYDNLQWRKYASNDFGGVQGVDLVAPTSCTASSCDLFITLYNLDASLADAIDEYIDGSNNRKTGRVRISVDASNNAGLFMKFNSILMMQ